MKTSQDVLFLRRPVLNYVAPPICDVLFSSSAGPVIVLNALGHLTGVTGLIFGGTGRFRLSWNSYPGALCYSVYQAVDLENPNTSEYILIAECIDQLFFEPESDGCFRVSAITLEGETPLSDPVCSGGQFGPPSVVTNPADNVDIDSARLNGTVNPKGFPTSAFFEWGLTTSYGNTTPPQDMGSGTSDTGFQDVISSLLPATTYHFRAAAVNANGTVFGIDRQFMTVGPSCEPFTDLVDLFLTAVSSNVGSYDEYFAGFDAANTPRYYFNRTTNAIPDLAGHFGQVKDVNSVGQMVGNDFNTDFSTNDIFWYDSVNAVYHIIPIVDNTIGGAAVGITPDGYALCVDNTTTFAFLWNPNTLTSESLAPYTTGWLNRRDNSHTVVVYDPGTGEPGIWHPGGAVTSFTIPGIITPSFISSADINNQGHAVVMGPDSGDFGRVKAAFWNGAVAIDMTGGTGDVTFEAMNNNDYTAGAIEVGGFNVPCFWFQGGAAIQIPMLPGLVRGSALAINNSNIIVGRMTDAGFGNSTAFVYVISTGITSTLLSFNTDANWTKFHVAYAITDENLVYAPGVRLGVDKNAVLKLCF